MPPSTYRPFRFLEQFGSRFSAMPFSQHFDHHFQLWSGANAVGIVRHVRCLPSMPALEASLEAPKLSQMVVWHEVKLSRLSGSGSVTSPIHNPRKDNHIIGAGRCCVQRNCERAIPNAEVRAPAMGIRRFRQGCVLSTSRSRSEAKTPKLLSRRWIAAGRKSAAQTGKL